jgi:hypothetical protein
MIAAHHAGSDHADPQRLPQIGLVACPLGTHIDDPIGIPELRCHGLAITVNELQISRTQFS